MGLKGYRLWVMGQLDSTCTAPPDVTPTRSPASDSARASAFSRAARSVSSSSLSRFNSSEPDPEAFAFAFALVFSEARAA
jgi:hypothetical protein